MSTTDRPDLALINEAMPLVRALTGLARVLSVAESRELLHAEEMDELMALAATNREMLGAMLERWQEHGEVGEGMPQCQARAHGCWW